MNCLHLAVFTYLHYKQEIFFEYAKYQGIGDMGINIHKHIYLDVQFSQRLREVCQIIGHSPFIDIF